MSNELKQPKTYGLYPRQINYVEKNYKKRGYRSASEMIEAMIVRDQTEQKEAKKAKVSNEAITSATA